MFYILVIPNRLTGASLKDLINKVYEHTRRYRYNITRKTRYLPFKTINKRKVFIPSGKYFKQLIMCQKHSKIQNTRKLTVCKRNVGSQKEGYPYRIYAQVVNKLDPDNSPQVIRHSDTPTNLYSYPRALAEDYINYRRRSRE